MTLDLSKFHPLLPKPKLTAGIIGAVATAIVLAILGTLGVDVGAHVISLPDAGDVTVKQLVTALGAFLGTWLAPEHAVRTQPTGFPEDDDGKTTLGTDATEYPPGGGSGPRGEAALND
jgi:hypothetical protein